MITIGNMNFNETICVKQSRKSIAKNETMSGANHGYTFGKFYMWDVSLAAISEQELNNIFNLDKFIFVDNQGNKANARIFENIRIDSKYNVRGIELYDVSLLIEEALT